MYFPLFFCRYLVQRDIGYNMSFPRIHHPLSLQFYLPILSTSLKVGVLRDVSLIRTFPPMNGAVWESIYQLFSSHQVYHPIFQCYCHINFRNDRIYNIISFNQIFIRFRRIIIACSVSLYTSCEHSTLGGASPLIRVFFMQKIEPESLVKRIKHV